MTGLGCKIIKNSRLLRSQGFLLAWAGLGCSFTGNFALFRRDQYIWGRVLYLNTFTLVWAGLGCSFIGIFALSLFHSGQHIWGRVLYFNTWGCGLGLGPGHTCLKFLCGRVLCGGHTLRWDCVWLRGSTILYSPLFASPNLLQGVLNQTSHSEAHGMSWVCLGTYKDLTPSTISSPPLDW
jgi:hypothetical protein